MSSTSSPHLFSREPLRLGIIFAVRRTGRLIAAEDEAPTQADFA